MLTNPVLKNPVLVAVALASIALGTFPALPQPAPDRSYDDAKRTLGAVFWQLDEMRWRIDDAAFDPAAVSAALRYDPEAIYAFVRNEIAYQPYPGLLRFGGGTLMNLAGNACDQAALLGEMLIAAGRTVRFAIGEPTADLTERLAALAQLPSPSFTAPRPFRVLNAQDREDLYWLGYSDAAIAERRAQAYLYAESFADELDYAFDLAMERLGPSIDGALAPERRPSGVGPHCWVRMQAEDGSWTDLDPTVWWLPAGSAALEPVVVADELPLSLAPTIRFRLDRDLDTGSGIETETLLEASSTLFRPVNEISAVFVPTGRDGEAPEDGQAEAYLWSLTVNNHSVDSRAFALDESVAAPPSNPTDAAANALNNIFGNCGLFGCAAEAVDPSPATPARLQRISLEIAITNAGGESVTERRVLVQAGESVPADSVEDDLRRQLSASFEAVVWGGRIEEAYVDARELDALLYSQAAYETMLDINYGVEPAAAAADLPGMMEAVNGELLEAARVRSALIEHAAVGFEETVHIGFPQMVAVRTGGLPSPTGGAARRGHVFDVLSNGLVVDGPNAARRHAELGIADTLIEYLMVGGGRSGNLYSVLVAAENEGVDWVMVAPGDQAARQSLEVSGLAGEQLDADLDAGYVVIAPARTVALAGDPTNAWLRVDPMTGRALGRGAYGGQNLVETPALEATTFWSEQKKLLPITLVLCAVFVGFAEELGELTNLIQGGLGENAPGPAAPRSARRMAAEYLACVVIGQALGGIMYAWSAASAGGAAAAAAAGGGAVAAAGGRAAGSRPPPAAARPQAPRPPRVAEPRYAEARPGGAPEPAAGSPGSSPRPVSARGGRASEFGRSPIDTEAPTVIDRPPAGTNSGTGTYVDGQSNPPARVRPQGPRTAGEQFEHLANSMFGEGAASSMPIANGRWQSMTPAQRRAALDAYRALRQGDPAGNPIEQFRQIMQEGRDFTGTPAEQVAQGALDSTLSPRIGEPNPGVNLRQLADAAGVTPQEMRQMLETRLAERSGFRERIEVGADGQVRVQPRDPALDTLSSRERQLVEMTRESGRSAVENARIRAAVDAERGLSVEESVAGLAHHESVPPYEYLNRTGHTPAEGVRHLSRYLERQGLSPAEARATAEEYFNQGGADPFATLPPPERPPGPSGGSAGGRGDPNTPPPPRGQASAFEPAPGASPSETVRMTPEQIADVTARAETVRLTPEQMREMADVGETVRMTPEEISRIATESETVRMTPEQQAEISNGAETVTLTPEQLRQMANSAETVRMTPEELQAVSERHETVRLTPEQLRRVAEQSETVQLGPAANEALPAPSAPRRNPSLPPEAEFQTPEAALRASDPDGLLPGERTRIAELDRRIAEVDNEFVIGERAELNQMAELEALRREQQSLQANGDRFQQRLDLRARQSAAGEFAIPADSPVAGTQQPTINAGRVPRRQMVQGDSDYLNAIMSPSRFEPTQNHIYSETVNARVNEILTTGNFPLSRSGLPEPVILREVAPNRYVIVDGHHGVVAGEVAARLSGRPLLPGDPAAPGQQPIIPAERLIIEPLPPEGAPATTARDVRGWRQVGVR